MGLKCCRSCRFKAILSRMKPICLQLSQEHGDPDAYAVLGAEVRQLTLEEIMYPAASSETEATGATPFRRNSPRVCPLNLDSSSEDDSPTVDARFSVDRVSLRSQNSVARRVSFRLPDESDILNILARRDGEDDSDNDEQQRM